LFGFSCQVANEVTDGDRINQGIADKLYTAVVGISLFFSSYIVALAVQWKLALITMTIIPANILIMGFCVRSDAPLEARIVRSIAAQIIPG
jgi:ATP-binding cassette subfamily B (MDR/TAP) protein 1